MSDLGKQLIETVRAKAAESPSFVYSAPQRKTEFGDIPGACLYIHSDGTPGCIIGQALFAAGLIDSSLYCIDANQERFNHMVRTRDLPVDPDEVRWLQAVQNYQDSATTWGHAVERADSTNPL